MMKMGSRSLFLIQWFLMAVILLPVIAFADAVPWTSELYTAYACVGEDSVCFDETTKYGPPLPISAGMALGIGPHATRADSSISDTFMDVGAKRNFTPENATGSAQFTGTYNANEPEFWFTYSLSTNSDAIAWLRVTDQTSGYILADYTLQPDSDQTMLSIDTTLNHLISVDFGVEATATSFGSPYSAGTLTYATAVAPEPISSVLFITGGSLFAGRRYIKRKNRA